MSIVSVPVLEDIHHCEKSSQLSTNVAVSISLTKQVSITDDHVTYSLSQVEDNSMA